MRNELSLYFIMGSPNCRHFSPEETLRLALEGGATFFQFREKGEGALTGEAKKELALRLQTICRSYRVPFLVNDDVALALAIDADGVHIGQDDAPAHVVRSQIGPDKILGVSARTVDEVTRAIKDGADYVGMGPIYDTTTKLDAKTPAGTSLIRNVRAAQLSIPITGIGGIHAHNYAPVIEAGGDGVSVISSIASSPTPLEVAQTIRRGVEQLKKNR